MTMGIWFWVIWAACFLFGIGWHRGWIGEHGFWGFGAIVMALFFLLGWHNFGFIVR